ncbi:hypothetical protein Tco_0403985 [Tanacetum coccineum]
MAYGEDDEEQMMEAGHKDAMENGDISILNSLVGHESPRSLLLWGKLGTSKVHILIDNGITHNFVQPEVVERMNLPVMNKTPFKVPTTLPRHRGDTGCVSQPDWPAVIVINHYQAPQITAGQSGCDTQPDVPTLTCAPGALVRKTLIKKGKWRNRSYPFCVDYRALNEATVKDKFSIPTADEMFNELGGASNQVVNAISRVFKEEEATIAAFMALS